MPKLRIEGLDKLEKSLKKNVTLSDVKKVVRQHGSQLQKQMQENADFRGHYAWEKGKGRVFKKPTGALKGSIGLEMKNGGLTAEVEPTKEYAPYVEYGTRFMDAQPFVKPAYNTQKTKFKRDMDKLVR